MHVFTSTRCIWTTTLFKCRVILKSMYTNIALCETHRISYREWKEEDWSLRFAREGVQNKRGLVLHVVFGPQRCPNFELY